MLSGTNSINSNNNNSLVSANDTNSLLNALGGSASSFDSIFTQAMNQATTPAAKMQDALLEVQYNDMNTLYNAVSGDGSSTDSLLGSSTSSLAMDLGSVSSQVQQLEQQLGITSSTPTGTTTGTNNSSASNTNAALGLEAGLLYNQDLANFGSSSSDSSTGLDALA
jgi:hypothetical protein